MGLPTSLRHFLLADIRAAMNDAGETVTESRLEAAVADWVARYGGTRAGPFDMPVDQAAE